MLRPFMIGCAFGRTMLAAHYKPFDARLPQANPRWRMYPWTPECVFRFLASCKPHYSRFAQDAFSAILQPYLLRTVLGIGRSSPSLGIAAVGICQLVNRKRRHSSETHAQTLNKLHLTAKEEVQDD